MATRLCVNRYSRHRPLVVRDEGLAASLCEAEAEPLFLRQREISQLLFHAVSLNVNADAQTFSGQVLLREESCSFGGKCISSVEILHAYINEDGGRGVDWERDPAATEGCLDD